MKQLTELAKPFKSALVKKAPQGKYGSYVSHSTVNEKLLAVVGPFDFEVVEAIRGYAPEVKGQNQTWPARDQAIVGCLARLTVTVDGRVTVVQEVGTEDTPAMHNDAENLKNAASDAFKRAAMRLGVGLHLWSQQDFFLHAYLTSRETPGTPTETPSPARKPDPAPRPSDDDFWPDEHNPPIGEQDVARCGECGEEDAEKIEQQANGWLCRDEHREDCLARAKF